MAGWQVPRLLKERKDRVTRGEGSKKKKREARGEEEEGEKRGGRGEIRAKINENEINYKTV